MFGAAGELLFSTELPQDSVDTGPPKFVGIVASQPVIHRAFSDTGNASQDNVAYDDFQFAAASNQPSSEPMFMGIGAFAHGLSGDGNVVVGPIVTEMGTKAYRWTETGGIDLLSDPDVKTSTSFATSVNFDGSVVAGHGFFDSFQKAFRWTADGGFENLGDLPGGPEASASGDVSNDGSVIAGNGFSEESSGAEEAFRWTSQGLLPLGDLPGGIFRSIARGISGDGNVIVGESLTSDTADDWRAFRWTEADGMLALEDETGGDVYSRAWNASVDGSVIVGTRRDTFGTEAYRWTAETGMVGLGDLIDGSFDNLDSFGSSVSADGSVIVGDSIGASGSREAFIWDELNGMRSVSELLVNDFGLDLTGWTLLSARSISDDGRTMAGNGTNPSGEAEGWIARLGNRPPTIDPQSFSMEENATFAGTVLASDPDLPDDVLTFSITGNGPDDARFTILPTGQLSFIEPPDFENPTDTGGTPGDNVYLVEVQVTDGGHSCTSAVVSVEVSDVAESGFLLVTGTTELKKFDLAGNLLGVLAFPEVTSQNGGGPGELGPDGNLYVVNFFDSKVIVIDPFSLTQVRTIDVSNGSGGSPLDTGFDSAGHLLVTKFFAGAVDVYDLDGTLIRTGLITGLNRADHVTQQNGKLYVGQRNGAGYGVFDETTGAVIAGPSITGGVLTGTTEALEFGPDIGGPGGTATPDGIPDLYVANRVSFSGSPPGTIAVFSGADNSLITADLVGPLAQPFGIGLLPNNDFVFSDLGAVWQDCFGGTVLY